MRLLGWVMRRELRRAYLRGYSAGFQTGWAWARYLRPAWPASRRRGRLTREQLLNAALSTNGRPTPIRPDPGRKE